MADENTDQQNDSTSGANSDASTTTADSKPTTTVEELKAALDEIGLTPGQIKARLEAGRKQEARAKENAGKAKEYDKLVAELETAKKANMSASEKEMEKLRTEAQAQGRAEAISVLGARTVQAEFKSLLAERGIEGDRAKVLVETLSTKDFFNEEDLSVRSEELTKYVDAWLPKDTARRPEALLGPAAFGAGQRVGAPSALGAGGLAEAERRGFIKKSA